VAFANEKEANTTGASGGGQVVASSINMLLDPGESAYADALVMLMKSTLMHFCRGQAIISYAYSAK